MLDNRRKNIRKYQSLFSAPTNVFSSYIVKHDCKKSHPTQLKNYIYHPQQFLAGFPISNCSRFIIHKQKVETLLFK